MRLNEAVEGFIQYLKIELNRPVDTVKGYGKDLQDFIRFVSNDGFTLAEFNPEVLSSYVRHLTIDRRHQPNTVRRKITAVRAFCSFLVNSEYLERNPAVELQPPRRPQKLPRHLPQSAVEQLLAAVPENGSSSKLRDKTILTCLYYTGMRSDELVNVKKEDVDLEKGFIRIVKAKGGRLRKVPLHPRLGAQLQKYMTEAPGLVNGYFFCNKQGARISADYVRDMVGKYARKADIGKRVTPHMLRHSFATHLYRSGVEITTVGKLLGHAELKSTAIYTHTDLQHLREGVEKLPVSKRLEERITKLEEEIHEFARAG